MERLKLFRAVIACLAASVATQSQALKINLINIGGVEPGTKAYAGFTTAAHYWESVFTNDVSVNLIVGFESFGADSATVLGQTSTTSQIISISDFENKLQTSRSNSKVDMLAAKHLPKTDVNGAIEVITPGYTFDANGAINGIDAHSRVFDTDGSTNNQSMFLSNANAKAIGYNLDNTLDGLVRFNSDFNFDFNPANGVADGNVNFLVVSIHEIGHALGFVSGVDNYDFFGSPNGPGAILYSGMNPNNDIGGSALDMFRYTSNPDGFGDGGPLLDWSIHNLDTDEPGAYTNPYFSIDGGDTALFGNLMSRGQFNTNSFQASHWRSASIAGQPYLGIMDPIGFTDAYITALDIAAFDTIGWNTRFDALDNPDYAMTTAEIYRTLSGVPELDIWAMMLAGFGLVGGMMRTERRKPAYALA